MKSSAKTVDQYLESLPQDRRAAITAVRKAILANLPAGYEERMNYGMIGYVVPHEIYPAGYRCDPKQPLPFACLGSQKNHMALYLMTVYGDPATETWFRQAWQASGKRLDMGKACVRFRRLEDVPLDVIGQVIARTPVKAYLARIQELTGARAKRSGRPQRRNPQKRGLHQATAVPN